MTNFVFKNPKVGEGVFVFDDPTRIASTIYPPINSDFLAWLKSKTAVRLVLVEAVVQVNGVETIRYMSNFGWKSGPNDNPPNQHYPPIIKTGIQFTEQLSMSGEIARLSTGDIEIENLNYERESWLDDIWTGRVIRAWIGDERWARADFQPIFIGVMAPIARKSDTRLALKLRDKSKRLDGAMTEHKLGGTGPNADSIIPLCFGECHNITPLLIDEGLLKYQVHDGAIEGFIEVRVNGQKVAFIGDSTTGTFILVRRPAGAVTCSVWGDKFGGVYRNTVGSIIRRIVKGYGKDMHRFTDDDLDLSNLNAFESTNQQAVGLYINDRTNVLVACQMLASSLGAQISMTRLGLMRLVKIASNVGNEFRAIRQSDFVHGSLQPSTPIDPVAAIKLNYCKNWTVQKGLLTDIPAAHIEMFASEWFTVTSVDDDVKADHKLSGEVIPTDTMLIDENEAQAEADRQRDLWKEVHIPYEGEGYPELLDLQLGQPIICYNDQYSMSEGKVGIVMRLTPDWDSGHVKVGFLV